MGKNYTEGKQSSTKSGYGTLSENGKEDSLDFTELRELYDDTVQKFTELLQRIDPEITLKLLKKSQIPKKLSTHDAESDDERYEKPQQKHKTKTTFKRPPLTSESDEEDVEPSKKAKEAPVKISKKIKPTKSELEDASGTDESDENDGYDDDDDEPESESVGSVIERAAAPRGTQSAFAPVLLNVAATTLLPSIADAAKNYVQTSPDKNNPYKTMAPMMQNMIRQGAPYGQGYPGNYLPNAYIPPMQTLGVPPGYPQMCYYPYQEQRPIGSGGGYSQGQYQGAFLGQQQCYQQPLHQVPQGPQSPSQGPLQHSNPSVQNPPDLKHSQPQEPLKQTTGPYQPPSVSGSTRTVNTTQPPHEQEATPEYQQGLQSPQIPPDQGNISGHPHEQQPQLTQAVPARYPGQTPSGLQFPPQSLGNDPNSIEVAQTPHPTKSASPSSTILPHAQEATPEYQQGPHSQQVPPGQGNILGHLHEQQPQLSQAFPSGYTGQTPSGLQFPPEPPKRTTDPYQPPSVNVSGSTRTVNTTQPPLAQEVIPDYQQGPQLPQVLPSQGYMSGHPHEQQPQLSQAFPSGYTGQTPSGLQFPPEPPKRTTDPYQPPSVNVSGSTRTVNTTQPPLGQEVIPDYQQRPQVPPGQGYISGQPQEQQPQPTQAFPAAYPGQTPSGLQFPPQSLGNDPNSIEVSQTPRPTKSASPSSTPTQGHPVPSQLQPPTDHRPSVLGQAQHYPGQEHHQPPPSVLHTPTPSPKERAPKFTKKKKSLNKKNNENTPPDVHKLEGEVLQSLMDIDDQINVILNKLEVKWD